MTKAELKDFLDTKVEQYNNPSFITSEPIQIPHKFSKKEDIEIAGFLSATIAWGNRKSIINNANKMMELLEHSPYDFVMNHEETDLIKLENFVHRTFTGFDFATFIQGLQHIYKNHNGLEAVFSKHTNTEGLQASIHYFKSAFFEIEHLQRTQKHISDPLKNSAATRITMFLRWMVRNDTTGVDSGLWKTISPSKLSWPLDVHSGNVARELGLLNRNTNDAQASTELDHALRGLDSKRTVKLTCFIRVGVWNI